MLARLFQLSLIIALAAHLMIPHSHAGSNQSSLDASGLFCTTPGAAVSTQRAKMLQQLIEQLEPSQNETPTHQVDCEVCVAASGAFEPLLDLVMVPVLRVYRGYWPSGVANTVSKPRGPPVGATGPPPLQLI